MRIHAIQSTTTPESTSILSLFPTEPHLTLSPKQFISMIHMSYGVTIDEDLICFCGHKIPAGTSPHHFAGCRRLAQSALTTRHDLIKFAIGEVQRLHLPADEVVDLDGELLLRRILSGCK